MADWQRLGLSLQSAVLPARTIIYGADVARHGVDHADRHGGSAGVECADPSGSAFADTGHDARRDCGDELDGADPAAVGAIGHGDAGDAVVVCVVSGGAVVQVLESATGIDRVAPIASELARDRGPPGQPIKPAATATQSAFHHSVPETCWSG